MKQGSERGPPFSGSAADGGDDEREMMAAQSRGWAV